MLKCIRRDDSDYADTFFLMSKLHKDAHAVNSSSEKPRSHAFKTYEIRILLLFVITRFFKLYRTPKAIKSDTARNDTDQK